MGFSALAVALVPPEPGEALSDAMGGGVGEAGEADGVWDELPAGSAAVAVHANAEAKASEVIRVCGFRGIPFVEVSGQALRGLIRRHTTPCHHDRVKVGRSPVIHRALQRLHWRALCVEPPRQGKEESEAKAR